MPPTNVVLAPVEEAEFPVLRQIATTIWRQHYTSIISAAQIDFMLSGRMSDDALRAQIRDPTRWLELLRVSGAPVGYCATELSDRVGDDSLPAVKLGQLYVLATHRGLGLGRLMLGHAERRARDLGRGMLWLQVNTRNTMAIGFYEAMGFATIREAVFDIGSGFVMDDYVMAKRV